MSQPFINTRLVANCSAGLGVFIGLNNIYGLLNPRGALWQLGFPVADSADDSVAIGMTRMFAATRIAGAVAQLAAWYYGAYKVLGWQMVAGILMATVDGYVSKQLTGKGEWGHWGAAPVGLSIGLYLLSST